MYCSPDQMMMFIDSTLIGDLCTDFGNRLTPTQIETDPNVLAALSAASGRINTAVLGGNFYAVSDLTALTGDDKVILEMMTAWLAFGVLCSRRGRDPSQDPMYLDVLDYLDQLKKGQRIFNVAANVACGVPNEIFASAVQYQTVNTLRTFTPRLFPVRREQGVNGNTFTG